MIQRFDILYKVYRACVKYYCKRWLNRMKTEHAYIYIWWSSQRNENIVHTCIYNEAQNEMETEC